MKSRKLLALIAVALSAAACGSSKSSDNADVHFPYSGPSCQGGPPGNSVMSGACSACVLNACPLSGSQATCIDSTCSSFYSCYCNCNEGDTSCYSGCQPKASSACVTCLMQPDTCGGAAVRTTCASQCLPSSTGSGASGSSSSGGSGPAPTGSCASVMSCCAVLAGNGNSAGCAALATSNNQSTCQEILAAWDDAGLCH